METAGRKRPAEADVARRTRAREEEEEEEEDQTVTEEEVEAFFAILHRMRDVAGCFGFDAGNVIGDGNGEKKAAVEKRRGEGCWKPVFRMEDFAEPNVGGDGGRSALAAEEERPAVVVLDLNAAPEPDR